MRLSQDHVHARAYKHVCKLSFKIIAQDCDY